MCTVYRKIGTGNKWTVFVCSVHGKIITLSGLEPSLKNSNVCAYITVKNWNTQYENAYHEGINVFWSVYTYFLSCVQLRPLLGPGEYGLSIYTDVALWVESRAFNKEPPLCEISDFVVVNGALHTNSMNSKRSKLTQTTVSSQIMHY